MRSLGVQAPRIINVASSIHKLNRYDWGDFNLRHSYSALRAYANSKLYQVIFTRELQQRLSTYSHIKVDS